MLNEVLKGCKKSVDVKLDVKQPKIIVLVDV